MPANGILGILKDNSRIHFTEPCLQNTETAITQAVAPSRQKKKGAPNYFLDLVRLSHLPNNIITLLHNNMDLWVWQNLKELEHNCLIFMIFFVQDKYKLKKWVSTPDQKN